MLSLYFCVIVFNMVSELMGDDLGDLWEVNEFKNWWRVPKFEEKFFFLNRSSVEALLNEMSLLLWIRYCWFWSYVLRRQIKVLDFCVRITLPAKRFTRVVVSSQEKLEGVLIWRNDYQIIRSLKCWLPLIIYGLVYGAPLCKWECQRVKEGISSWS